VQRKETRRIYVAAAIAHVAGSLISGAIAGALLGIVGNALPLNRGAVWMVAALVAGVLFVRDLHLLEFPVPQWGRQTRGSWYRELGAIRAAWLWGLDLGSGMTTFVFYSGYWVVVLGAAFTGSALQSACILAAYGLGRGAVVLLPAIPALRANLVDVFDAVLWQRPQLSALHTLGLLAFGVTAGLAAVPHV